MPGTFTPTEIFNAQREGADIVKVFPADVLGMSFFKSIKAPMPDLKIMPTGGVTLDNAGDWIKSGACAVGIGSALLDERAIEENNFNKLTQNAQRIMNSINSVDKPKLVVA
jgi:2-dehydro-3-deoxyphosphogluconate aldolase/(4S)-4-hydroxy-2-oxoglutarate aldolase